MYIQSVYSLHKQEYWKDFPQFYHKYTTSSSSCTFTADFFSLSFLILTFFCDATCISCPSSVECLFLYYMLEILDNVVVMTHSSLKKTKICAHPTFSTNQ